MKFTSFVKSKTLKSVGAVSVALALGAGLAGCGGNGAGGDVAATVNGQNIMEQTVTDYIADFRKGANLESDEQWGQWMVSNGYTPESVREEVINYYVDQDLYEQAAKEYNVAVEQADIDAQLEQTKAMFESEEAFQEALTASNMTEESYIEKVITPTLLQQKLSEAVAASNTEEGGDDAVLAQAQQAAEQWNGAKRVSHILFQSDDTVSDEELAAQAQDVLNKINAGELSFEEAAQQYSADSSAQNGGDVGWDKLSTFVTEFQDGVNGLSKDQVSELVKTDYGYHIIKVTDEFTLPEGGLTSLDQLPDDFRSYLEYMQQSNDSQSFATWFAEYRENAEVVINPMPEGLPYAIDLAPYQQAADDAANQAETPTVEEGTEAGTDQAPTDESAGQEPSADDQASTEGGDAATDQQTDGTAPEGTEGGDAAGDQTGTQGGDAAGDQTAGDQTTDGTGDQAADGTQGDQTQQ